MSSLSLTLVESQILTILTKIKSLKRGCFLYSF